MSGEPGLPWLPSPSNVFFLLPRLENQLHTIYGIEFKLGELDIAPPLSCMNLVVLGRFTNIVHIEASPLWCEDPIVFLVKFIMVWHLLRSITSWTICIERNAKAFNHVQWHNSNLSRPHLRQVWHLCQGGMGESD